VERDGPEVESGTGEDEPTVPPANRTAFTDLRGAPGRLLRKRVKKFVALVPAVLTGSDPEAVHDARVASRRLQQAVSAFFPKPRSGKARQLRRKARRVRRALGDWRNCDVLLDLVGRRQRRARREAKRRAWEFVQAHLIERQGVASARARKKLLRQDTGDCVALLRWLLDHPPAGGARPLGQRLSASVRDAWAEWQSALARAQDSRAVADLHAFRVATKDLRYRTELLHDLGLEPMKSQLRWLAELQEALGAWHDREMLHQAVAEAVGRPDILLNALPSARVLLAELETERNRPAKDVERIFRLALEHPGHTQMHRWSAAHSAPAHHVSPAGSEGMTGMTPGKNEVNA
jgi:CHAD domain-containing protein